MVSVTVNPADPSQVILTQTATLYLDRLAVQALSDEVEKAIRLQAAKDLKGNPEVRKIIAEAATKRLLDMLQVSTVKGPSQGDAL